MARPMHPAHVLPESNWTAPAPSFTIWLHTFKHFWVFFFPCLHLNHESHGRSSECRPQLCFSGNIITHTHTHNRLMSWFLRPCCGEKQPVLWSSAWTLKYSRQPVRWPFIWDDKWPFWLTDSLANFLPLWFPTKAKGPSWTCVERATDVSLLAGSC